MILVIEDEQAQRHALVGFLRKRGFEVEGAASGAEGIERLRDAAVDLVLTDYRMPEMNGMDVLRAVKAINPDVFMFVHSDGNVMDLMDDIVEIGFDIVNPIQPECMNPAEVKRRWGDRITLHGGVSIQKTFPYGTPREVRAEIEELIRTCGYNGGLVVFPSNVVQPDTPVENIRACFHTVRDYDMSRFIS